MLERAVSGRQLLHTLSSHIRSLQDHIILVEPIRDYSDCNSGIQATKLRPHASHQYGCLHILAWIE